MPLYGADLSPDQTPAEAGLMSAVDLAKPFVGRDAVASRVEAGPREMRIGFKMASKRAAREGDEIRWQGKTVGRVTSGSFAPSLGCAIGMGYVAGDVPEAGDIELIVRGKALAAQIARLPFYEGTARQ